MPESTALMSDSSAPKSACTVQKLALPALIAMVAGSMIGSGIFTLPSRVAQATGVYGALIAWVIAAGGMLMLAFVFQTLAARKPDVDSGIFAYAKYGFGEYWGFAAAVGFGIGTGVVNRDPVDLG